MGTEAETPNRVIVCWFSWGMDHRRVYLRRRPQGDSFFTWPFAVVWTEFQHGAVRLSEHEAAAILLTMKDQLIEPDLVRYGVEYADG